MSAKLEKFVPFKNPFESNQNYVQYFVASSIIFSLVFSLIVYLDSRSTRLKVDRLSSQNANVLFPTTNLISGLSPIVTTNDEIPNAFGTLSNRNYLFSGTFKAVFNSVSNVPSYPTDYYYGMSLRIGTSTLSINYFSLPNTASTFVSVPVTYLWNTSSVDGLSPTLKWTFSLYDEVSLSGNATISLTGVMIPL